MSTIAFFTFHFKEVKNEMFPLILIDLQGANTDVRIILKEPLQLNPKGATVLMSCLISG